MSLAVAAIGGGASGVFYSSGPGPASLPGGAVLGVAPSVFDLPSASTSGLLERCANYSLQMRQRTHRTRYGAFDDADSSRREGTSRQGALFCRTGVWLEILDEDETPPDGSRSSRPRNVRGSKSENSTFSILEFISVAFGLVSIRGVQSQRYLCMDSEGRLYGAVSVSSRGELLQPRSNYSTECIFVEEMLENYYNLYASCAHGREKKPWYVALRPTGRPRRGPKTRRRRKSAHFLVVHYDTTPTPSRVPARRFALPGRPPEATTTAVDLDKALDSALKHRPPRNRHFRSPAEIKNVQAVLKPYEQRRRDARLRREEIRRQKRIEELERLQVKERQRQRETNERFRENEERLRQQQQQRRRVTEVTTERTPSRLPYPYERLVYDQQRPNYSRTVESTSTVSAPSASDASTHRHHSAYGGFSRPVETRQSEWERRRDEYYRQLEARRRQR